MEKIRDDIIGQSLEILKSNIPGLLTMLMVNPKSINKKTIILSLFLPILTNLLKYYIEFLRKSRELDFKIKISGMNKFNHINIDEIIHSFLENFTISEENSLGYNKLVISKDKIDIVGVNETDKITGYFSEENIEKYITENNPSKKIIQLLSELKNEKIELKYGNVDIFLQTKNSVVATVLFDLVTNLEKPKSGKKPYSIFTKSNISIAGHYYPITFDHIFLKENSQIKTQIDMWKSQENYYKDNFLPYKFAILLHGEPGTGKTSIAKVLSTYLNYSYAEIRCDLSNEFGWIEREIAKYPKTVILIDELDRMIDSFNTSSITSESSEKQTITSSKNGINLINSLMKMLESSSINDAVIIITTNKSPDYFDPALMRPGRIDYCEHFSNCDSYQFKKIYQRYVGGEIPQDYVFPDGKYSPSHVINRVCVPWHKLPEKVFELLK